MPAGPEPSPAAASADEGDSARDAIDVRWILGAAALVAVSLATWKLYDRSTRPPESATPPPAVAEQQATDSGEVRVALMRVPDDATILLDGSIIERSTFTVRTGSRHRVSVEMPGQGVWQQVFIAHGEVTLVVDRPVPEDVPEGAAPPPAAPEPEAPPAATMEPEPPPAATMEPEPPPAATMREVASTMRTSTMRTSSSMTSTRMTSTRMSGSSRMGSSRMGLARDPGF